MREFITHEVRKVLVCEQNVEQGREKHRDGKLEGGGTCRREQWATGRREGWREGLATGRMATPDCTMCRD